MVSRKRQRSALEPEPELDDGHEGTSNASLSSSSLQRKRVSVATTIAATLLASSALVPPVVAAEENLLHPEAAFRPLQQAVSAPSSGVPASFLSCQDDATYVSPSGLSCSDHRPFGCQKSGIETLGYDLLQTAELLANCPQSCGVPPCEVHDYDLMREEEWPQQQPQHSQEEKKEEDITAAIATAGSAHRSLLSSDDGDGEVDPSSRPIAAQALSSRLRGSSSVDRPQSVTSCHAGWHPLCQDDPSYVSKTGLPCEFHSSFDCSSWTKVGYTDMEVYDLINSCPCACAVPCGYVLYSMLTVEPSLLCLFMTFSIFVCSITS